MHRLRDQTSPRGARYDRFNALLQAETEYVRGVFALRNFNRHVYHGYHAEPLNTVLDGFPRQGVDTVEAPDEPNSSLAPLAYRICSSAVGGTPVVLPPIDSLL